jgi:hypothetical protein
MRAFVIGAGVSKCAGYPLGIELFDAVDTYIRRCGVCHPQFDKNDWRNLLRWLERHKNPLIAEAHRQRLIEYLFTLLDIGRELRLKNARTVYKSLGSDAETRLSAERGYKACAANVRAYQKYRQILLYALEAFLDSKHAADAGSCSTWDLLHDFARRIRPGDVVITFNYDSTVERVLMQIGKWSPTDGYGFRIQFRKRPPENEPVQLPRSEVQVLHLHGAVGWYGRSPMQSPEEGGDAGLRGQLCPSESETEIALSPSFLVDLGVDAVDVTMADGPKAENPIYLHPSFIKDYELENFANDGIIKLWKSAARVLRNAAEVHIVGYSLPKADSAALTLLLTNTDRERVSVVNQNVSHNHRLRQLLSARRLGPTITFSEWLKSIDC